MFCRMNKTVPHLHSHQPGEFKFSYLFGWMLDTTAFPFFDLWFRIKEMLASSFLFLLVVVPFFLPIFSKWCAAFWISA
jgi:hypothetical protein